MDAMLVQLRTLIRTIVKNPLYLAAISLTAIWLFLGIIEMVIQTILIGLVGFIGYLYFMEQAGKQPPEKVLMVKRVIEDMVKQLRKKTARIGLA
ncbi:MAG: hypothetical protein HQL54_06830 [Magnetococcales bacterium]|nr:hypothetical protein [Magnetococcales bacterium]